MTDLSPRLDWTDDGAPVSGRFGDVYFSREDGLAETRAVFLQGCGLPDAWRDRRRFVVAELGFGTGLNVAALIDLWLRARPPNGRLHVFSVEGFPLDRDAARKALSAWPELGEITEALLEAWPPTVPGFHRLNLPPDWGVTLDLAIGPVDAALESWEGLADAWFLDGFAPAANPDMWSEGVMALVAARSAPAARLATFTVAGDVRRRLQAQGFQVDKRPGHGRKRERLEAVAPGPWRAEPSAPNVVVIGAGVAGLSVARALADLGLTPTVVEAEGIGAGASGFPSALVTPRLDVGDETLAALFAQALRHAAATYDAIDGAVLQKGVLQLEQAPRDAARYDRVAAQAIWTDGAMRRLAPDQVSDLLGERSTTGGLAMADARVIQPAVVLAALRAGLDVRSAHVKAITPTGEGSTVYLADGSELAADAVVLACGWGVAALAPDLRLAPVRGQADWAEGVAAPAAAWGGYLAPTATGLLYGATHDRGRTDVGADPEDTRRNLATLATRLPDLGRRVAAVPGASRAAVRATTPDRLPVAGALGPGLHVLGGLGSRGFALAPLLGAHVAASLVGAPSPLPLPLSRRVSPARLLER